MILYCCVLGVKAAINLTTKDTNDEFTLLLGFMSLKVMVWVLCCLVITRKAPQLLFFCDTVNVAETLKNQVFTVKVNPERSKKRHERIRSNEQRPRWSLKNWHFQSQSKQRSLKIVWVSRFELHRGTSLKGIRHRPWLPRLVRSNSACIQFSLSEHQR